MSAPQRQRTLGLLGGMSWTSTAVYYRLINEGVAAHCGGMHGADLLLRSIDFAPLVELQKAGDWDRAAALLAGEAAALRRAGAQALLVATNTMHKVAARIEADGGLPLLHIADATGDALRAAGVQRALLLGTRFTMEDPSIVRDRLLLRHGVDTVTPDAAGRATMHGVIFEELCRGVVRDASRDAVVALIEDARRSQDADAVILGCTEIMLLIDAACSPLPVFDTTVLHAGAAVQWLCGGGASEVAASVAEGIPA